MWPLVPSGLRSRPVEPMASSASVASQALRPSPGRNLVDLGIFLVGAIAFFIALGWYVTSLQAGGVQVGTTGVSVERGESIFWGTGPVKGTCSTCHSIGERGNMRRCPNQDDPKHGGAIGARAADRAKEREAKTGKPYTATDYLVESIADPSAYVVKGFPDKLMPIVYRGQIDLEPEDVMSVIAYLQSIGGEVDLAAIQVSMSRHGQAILAKESGDEAEEVVRRIDLPYPEWEVLEPEQFSVYQPLSNGERKAFLKDALDEEQQEILGEIEEEWAVAGRKVFEEFRCWQCHIIAGEDFGAVDPGKIGPELSGIGAIQPREYLLESILNPNALIVPPLEDHAAQDGRSKMPSYVDLIGMKDLLPLTVFLSSLDGSASPSESSDASAGAADEGDKDTGGLSNEGGSP